MGSVRRVALALGAAVAVVGGTGVALVARDDPRPAGAPPAAASPSASPLPTVPPVVARTPSALVADVRPGAPDSPHGVAAVLARELRDPALGSRVNALVVDAETGAELYESSPDLDAIPASTTKVFTAVAALKVLGPDRRFDTRVVADGTIANGVLDGDLVVIGGGDPTLTSDPTPDGYPRAATLDSLAAQVRKAGIRRVTGTLTVDTSLFDGPRLAAGWKPTYVTEGSVAPITAFMADNGRVALDDHDRHPNPHVLAALRLRTRLTREGVRIGDRIATGPAPVTATEVATVSSPPVSALVERMLVRSDNELAEALARHVAIARGLSADFAGAGAALAATVEEVGVDPPRLNDGSGLSRLNRVTPRQLVAVLTAAANDPALRPAVTGLPVAAFTGTLAGRFDERESKAGAGYVRAKTGSLDNVATLAGVIHTRGGRTLVFAFTADRLPTRYVGGAARAFDEATTALARCGCP